MDRLIEMVEKAYHLAVQVMDDNRDERVLQVLAEEVSGGHGEFLALWAEDRGAFGDDECIDAKLVDLINKLKGTTS